MAKGMWQGRRLGLGKGLLWLLMSGAQSIGALGFELDAPSLARSSYGFVSDVKKDFGNYFLSTPIFYFGDALLVSGVLANTGLDRAVRKTWNNGHPCGNSLFFKLSRRVGTVSSWWSYPVYAASVVLGKQLGEGAAGDVLRNWGNRSLRTALLGGLQQVAWTNLLGSGRPNWDAPSKWQPFKYTTGVSGHALFGAIPFLTAAQMTDPLVPKTLLYMASTLSGLSRINDDKHYLSQVLMGWSIAFLSSKAVYETDEERARAPFEPIISLESTPRSSFLQFKWRY